MNRPLVPAHVAVVGGGLSGLVAALLLARRGVRVKVFERSAHPGGRARSPQLGGVPVNPGGHGIYRRGEAARVLRALGVPLRGGVPPKRGQLLVDGAPDLLPFSPWSILRAQILRGERVGYARFLTRTSRCDAASLGDVSWQAWVDEQRPGPGTARLAHVFARLTTYIDAPTHVPARIVVRQLQRALGGVLYLDGGWQSLVDLVAAQCEQAGVVLRPGCAVGAVRTSAGRVVGVDVEGRPVAADAVVLATPPAVSAALVPSSAALRDAAAAAVPACLACLDVVLDRRPAPSAPYLTMGVDTPIHAIMHSDVASFGDGAVLHAHRYLPPGDAGAADRGDVEGVVDVAFEGWRAHVRQARWLPRMVVMHDTPRVGHRRAEPAATGVAGLWQCGDHVGDDVLLDAALASAEQAAHHALAHLSHVRPGAT